MTVALQVPETFDPANACMVTATSSGSRGVYGAIGTSGEWGLKKGCAVVYVDKGTGTGFFDLQNRKGYTVQGEFVDADKTVEPLNFDPKIPRRELDRYNRDNPNRWAIKHAHSQENPEEDWGTDTLRAIQFGFYQLNRHFADDKSVGRITPANTLVIASSVSNGGAGALRAAEEDKNGWIDGVAVSEPNVNPKRDRSFTIQQGNGQPLVEHGRPLYDYITFYTLYEGCAAATAANARAAQVCTDLKSRGLIDSGGPLEAQAAEARERIRQHGILPEQNVLAAFYWSAQRLPVRRRRLCERLFQGQRDRQPLRLLLCFRRCDRQAGAAAGGQRRPGVFGVERRAADGGHPVDPERCVYDDGRRGGGADDRYRWRRLSA